MSKTGRFLPFWRGGVCCPFWCGYTVLDVHSSSNSRGCRCRSYLQKKKGGLVRQAKSKRESDPPLSKSLLRDSWWCGKKKWQNEQHPGYNVVPRRIVWTPGPTTMMLNSIRWADGNLSYTTNIRDIPDDDDDDGMDQHYQRAKFWANPLSPPRIRKPEHRSDTFIATHSETAPSPDHRKLTRSTPQTPIAQTETSGKWVDSSPETLHLLHWTPTYIQWLGPSSSRRRVCTFAKLSLGSTKTMPLLRIPAILKFTTAGWLRNIVSARSSRLTTKLYSYGTGSKSPYTCSEGTSPQRTLVSFHVDYYYFTNAFNIIDAIYQISILYFNNRTP